MEKPSVQGVNECGRTSVQGVYEYEKRKLQVFINVKGGHYRVLMKVRRISEETVALRCQAITRYLHGRTDEKNRHYRSTILTLDTKLSCNQSVRMRKCKLYR
jgi:hypothetical protein